MLTKVSALLHFFDHHYICFYKDPKSLLPKHCFNYYPLNEVQPFTWFAKPLALSPLHCAQYGWENSEVDILQCVSCRACLDATISTTWDSEICEYFIY